MTDQGTLDEAKAQETGMGVPGETDEAVGQAAGAVVAETPDAGFSQFIRDVESGGVSFVVKEQGYSMAVTLVEASTDGDKGVTVMVNLDGVEVEAGLDAIIEELAKASAISMMKKEYPELRRARVTVEVGTLTRSVEARVKCRNPMHRWRRFPVNQDYDDLDRNGGR